MYFIPRQKKEEEETQENCIMRRFVILVLYLIQLGPLNRGQIDEQGHVVRSGKINEK
jgi:hypothetical protein